MKNGYLDLGEDEFYCGPADSMSRKEVWESV